MLNRLHLEELIKREEKSPLVINMIAKRVRQLFRGDKSMIEDRHLTDAVDIALKEFIDGKLQVKKGHEEK